MEFQLFLGDNSQIVTHPDEVDDEMTEPDVARSAEPGSDAARELLNAVVAFFRGTVTAPRDTVDPYPTVGQWTSFPRFRWPTGTIGDNSQITTCPDEGDDETTDPDVGSRVADKLRSPRLGPMIAPPDQVEVVGLCYGCDRPCRELRSKECANGEIKPFWCVRCRNDQG